MKNRVAFTDEAIRSLSRIPKGERAASALILPVDENTDLETLILSNSRRFWEIMDNAGQSGRLTSFEDLPEIGDDNAWDKLGSGH